MKTTKIAKNTAAVGGASKKSKQRPDDATALVAVYTAAAQSKATQRSYEADMRHFTEYGGTIPATAEMVAEYLAHFAGFLAVATLQHRIVAIHRAHTDLGLESPTATRTVSRCMQGIRRTYGVKQRRVRALVKEDLFGMMVHLDKLPPLRRARDIAVILCGFAAALRRSEIVALEVSDITTHSNGLELAIRRSKTDQEGAGRIAFLPFANGARCPVKALRHWLELAEIVEGPLFRQISRHDKIVGTKALVPQSVALIVKAAVRAMSGDAAAEDVAGHSLRAGFCTEAANVGMANHLVRGQTGHRGDSSLQKYVRPASQRKIPTLL